MRRSGIVTLTTALAMLAVPAAASADCAKTVSFKGSARAAEFSGGGGLLGPRKLTVGEPVARKLEVGEVYYVPKGKSLRVKLHGYTSRAAAGTVFLVQCDIWTGKDLYFRLLEGSVKVSGRKIGPAAKGAPAGSYVVTPEATMLPLPGRPSYVAKRVVTSSRKSTRTSVQSRRGGSNLFVKLSTLAKGSKQIPCQAGAGVTVFGNGKYRRT